MPNCTVIKTGATVVRTTSERVEELKEVIKNIKVPLVGEVGDAVLYDNQALTFVMVKPENISAEDYPLSRYTPIGVVAIPTSHNVYGTGECGVVSLMEMDYNAPDKGTTSFVVMYWGQYNTDTVLPNLNKAVQVGTTLGPPTSEATGETSYVDLPSDEYASYVPCPTDPEAGYRENEYDDTAGPSPYLADGSRNPVYYQTTEPTSEANCLADFDGVGNTKELCDIANMQDDWRTAETIDNQYAAGYSPAACCCWRFHTDGTKQGDWYLPAAGEFGYVAARMKKINTTIKAIVDAYGSDKGVQLDTIDGYWSSSEYSNNNARSFYMNSVLVNNYYKNYGDYYAARAFLRV